MDEDLFISGAEADISSNGDTNQNAMERTYADVNSLLEKEEEDIGRAITEITEVQVCKMFEMRAHDVKFVKYVVNNVPNFADERDAR